jgi:hypothetical protein
MRRLGRSVLFGAAAALLLLAGAVRAAGDPAKDLAALDESFESTELKGAEIYEEFVPKYESFAKKHAGTDEALAAKMRLLEFTGRFRNDAAAMNAAAAGLVDAILKEYPRSERLDRLPALAGLFTKEKFAEVRKALEDPKQPDRVKAALLLADDKYADLLAQYKDVPYRWTTYGAIADAKINPHPPAALEIGQPAPDIVGKTIDGTPLKLSDFKGRVVVVDFFGDW